MKNPTGRPKTKAAKTTNARGWWLWCRQTKPIDWQREPEDATIARHLARKLFKSLRNLRANLRVAERRGDKAQADALNRKIEYLGVEQESASAAQDRRSGKVLKQIKVRRNARTRPEHLTAEQRREFNRDVAPRLARERTEKAGLLSSGAPPPLKRRSGRPVAAGGRHYEQG